MSSRRTTSLVRRLLRPRRLVDEENGFGITAVVVRGMIVLDGTIISSSSAIGQWTAVTRRRVARDRRVDRVVLVGDYSATVVGLLPRIVGRDQVVALLRRHGRYVVNENFVGNIILSVVELLGACYTWMNKNVMDRPFVVVLYIIERRWFCRGVRDQSFRTTHDDVDRCCSILLLIKLLSILSCCLRWELPGSK